MEKKKEVKKIEKKEIGMTAEKDNFSEWFTQLILKADLADYTDVSGCIVFKPTSYAIWERIKEECDRRFKKLGVRNAYFPLFIPESLLAKEQQHVKGFAPEVAWVTQAGETKLSERLAVRPTSEAIMYPSYSKWIRSWRDMPLRLNQWNNSVRWEFTHPVPFLRTREFLWNEMHNAYASEEECVEEGRQILNIYQEICEDYLSLYGIAGRKTENEKFAGAVFSEKIHYIMPNGKSLEGPCFHYDGTNFAKAYDIRFLDNNKKEQFAHQSTFAISSRMLGVLFAVHSDSKGLILPPRMAPNPIVIIPIFSEKDRENVLKEARKIRDILAEYSPLLDEREEYRPGFKFNEYELKGIPLRIEIGARDIERKEVIAVRRDDGKKQPVKMISLKKEIPEMLEDIQKTLFRRSKKLFEDRVERGRNLSGLKKIIEDKKVGIIPLCKSIACEDQLKAETGGKALFISKDRIKREKCIICKKKADYFVYSGKSY